MPTKDRRIAWQKIASAKKQIIIGTRLALFTPIQDLKGIILDHEHAYGWKEEQSPRYDTRRCVELLQKVLNIPVLFSAHQQESFLRVIIFHLREPFSKDRQLSCLPALLRLRTDR